MLSLVCSGHSVEGNSMKKHLSLVFWFAAISVLSCQSLGAQEWKRMEDVNPMTDERKVGIATGSLQTPRCSIANDLAVLQFECQKDQVVVALRASGCVMGTDSVLNYRVDKEKASVLSAEPSEDPTLIFLEEFLGEAGASQALFEKFINASSVIIEIKPFASQPEIVSFDLSKMAEIAGDDFDSCRPDKRQASATPLAGPRSSESVENLILEQLQCTQLPSPAPVLAGLEQRGLIDLSKNIGFDSLSCFEIKDGLTISGITFSHVCGYEEDDTIKAQYPDMFYRGPGTSPGQTLAFYTYEDEATAEEWLRNTARSSIDERIVDSRFPDFANTSVGCTSWIVK